VVLFAIFLRPIKTPELFILNIRIQTNVGVIIIIEAKRKSNFIVKFNAKINMLHIVT